MGSVASQWGLVLPALLFSFVTVRPSGLRLEGEIDVLEIVRPRGMICSPGASRVAADVMLAVDERRGGPDLMSANQEVRRGAGFCDGTFSE